MSDEQNNDKVRKIKKVFRSKPTIEGAGVHLKRAFGFAEVPTFDPFLLFDDFRNLDPQYYIKGFPWHPHRGIETITYVLEGAVEHGDSIGNKGIIGPGDVQWMTAGSGILHQEMPAGDKKGRMGGFQLWVNLPASHKMTEPNYQEITSSEIPELVLDNGTVIRIICGKIKNTEGAVKKVIVETEYLDITVPKNTQYIHPTKPEHIVFAYIIDGQALICQEKNPFNYEMQGANYFDIRANSFLGNEDLVLFDAGNQVVITTEDHPVRLLLFSGLPLGEPIAWRGPIVMNTQEELRTAFEEYRNGTFIKS
jgi:redox-sensitive bicupin YhaK (pirin superfamily)